MSGTRCDTHARPSAFHRMTQQERYLAYSGFQPKDCRNSSPASLTQNSAVCVHRQGEPALLVRLVAAGTVGSSRQLRRRARGAGQRPSPTEQRTSRVKTRTETDGIDFPMQLRYSGFAATPVGRTARPQGDCLLHHQSHCRTKPNLPPGHATARPLVDREPCALGPRRHLRGGPLPGPHRHRAPGDGYSAQPCHQRLPAGQSHQHRSRRALGSQRPQDTQDSPPHTTLP